MNKKFKIAYSEDDEDIRDLYGTMIEGTLDCELVEFCSGNDLIAYLKNNNDVDLVLTDYNMPNGTGGDVYTFLKEDGNKIPCILISSDSPKDHKEMSDFFETNKNNHSVLKPFEVDELLEFIKKLIPTKESREYKPVKIERFLKHNPVSVDVFIRLSEFKYIKLFKQGELFNENQLQRYMTEKNVEYLYVKSESFELFCESFSKQLNSILSKKDLKPEDRLGTELKGVAFVHETCKELGVNQATIDAVNAITESTLSVIKKKNTKIFDLLSQMMNSDSFLYSHSLLTSYVACEIAQRMEWNSEAIYQKLSIAALLHDVGLNEKLSEYNILSNEIEKTLDPTDLDIIKTHPHRNYELVHEINSLPADVDTIILNHHERADGSGFPRGLGAIKTAPLSCTFILAHEFVHRFFDNDYDHSKVKEIVKSIGNEFNKGNYKKPLEGLVKIVED